MSTTRRSDSEGASVLAEELLRRLEQAGRKGLAETAVETEGARDEEMAAALELLSSTGVAVRWSRRWYATANTEWRVARVGPRNDGIASLFVAGEGESEMIVRESNSKGARRGDRVLVKRLRSAKQGTPPEASVVRILERARRTLVGKVRPDRSGQRAWLAPFDSGTVDGESVRLVAPWPEEEDLWIVVALEEDSREGLRALVVEELGRTGDPGVDTLVVLRHFEIPDEFPEEVEAAAQELPDDPPKKSFTHRENLRSSTVVTIDGATARDFDDAISLERRKGGGWRLGVHIADVAHYVRPGSGLDREARQRGTSVYFPERAVPMLPERLSNGLCSLRPRVPRLVQSVFMDFDSRGRRRRSRFAQAVIESSARLTYEQVARFLDGGEVASDGAGDEITPEVGSLLREADELLERLLERRAERGGLDFDLPVHDLVLDQRGELVAVEAGVRTRAHRLIEEFMIAANEAVAEALVERDVAALFRVHDPPSPERLRDLHGLLATLEPGLETFLDGESGSEDDPTVSPRSLQRILTELEGRDEAPLVSAIVLRTLKRAVYLEENRGHYALGSQAYSHFTSPIRRYPDLVVHRQLSRLSRGQEVADPPSALQRGLADWCSFTEQRAERAERDILQWKKVRLLEERIGELFQGRITGVQEFGFFVQLEEFLVDGLVPIATLRDDYYWYDTAAFQLEGEKSGRRFRLADRVEVRLVGVSELHRGLDLEIADMPAAEPERGGRGPRERGRSARPPRRGRDSGVGTRRRSAGQSDKGPSKRRRSKKKR